MDIKFSGNGSPLEIPEEHGSYTLIYPCGSDKQNCYPIEATLPRGSYLLEVWGASGCHQEISVNKVANGGYSRGVLFLSYPTKAYFYIGASGTFTTGINSFAQPSFNGGGAGKNGHDGAIGTSGGGGTDIRLEKSDLYHRVIVAGGDGGVSNNYTCTSGHGGGITGTTVSCTHPGTVGKGGEQTGPENRFGFGSNVTTNDGCGGGGGWFGGTAGNGYEAAGGGGSGFIFTPESYQIAQEAKLALPKKYFLRYASMSNGSDTSYSGDGKIVITYLPSASCATLKFRNPYISYLSAFCIFFLVSK